MNDASPSEPRFDEPPASATRQVAASDWNRPEIEVQPETPLSRERLFPRKTLIGWALFAVALYFGVRLVTTVIKDRVRESVVKGTYPRASTNGGNVVIMLPNGKRITIGENGAEVSRPQTPPTRPAPKAEPAAATPAIPPAQPKR